MGKYIVKRVLLLIPTVILVCLIVFTLMRMIPGDAVDTIVNRLTSSGMSVDADAVRAQLGLDQPFFKQFFTWLWDICRGDLGDSFFENESVWSIISRELPKSLELGLLTLLFTNLLSIPLGLHCAARQDSLTDYVVRMLSIVFMALPVFLLATLVLVYPAIWWNYAPPITWSSIFQDFAANMKMFLVPAILGAITQCAMQIRTIRTVTLEVMRMDYIRTAWAKGDSERTVLFRHAFRNSMIPVITMIGNGLGMVVGGNVILENLFNIPGIGNQVIASLSTRDYPVVMGCTLVFAVVVMVVNLIVDIAYKWVDPRVELD
ncbi:MAG: ABC transporter permease [Oscillospiraceae bacterium]|nr:ABC transporter permease [Oscillospiraceae bacterium]MCD7844546.1 ABC transporter permease [Oscillospiraceae bacterium]